MHLETLAGHSSLQPKQPEYWMFSTIRAQTLDQELLTPSIQQQIMLFPGTIQTQSEREMSHELPIKNYCLSCS